MPLKPGVDANTPVPDQVLAMWPDTFFNRLNQLLVRNPPSPMTRRRWIASPSSALLWAPSFTWRRSRAKSRKRFRRVLPPGRRPCARQCCGKVVNGWQIALDLGRYGTNYVYRAGWTFFGVGGNLAEDAVYPVAAVDGDGKPFVSANRYVLRFTKEQFPPVQAFWSLTMYDPDSYLVPDPIKRYALGSERDEAR